MQKHGFNSPKTRVKWKKSYQTKFSWAKVRNIAKKGEFDISNILEVNGWSLNGWLGPSHFCISLEWSKDFLVEHKCLKDHFYQNNNVIWRFPLGFKDKWSCFDNDVWIIFRLDVGGISTFDQLHFRQMGTGKKKR